jgi:hypothetical protein
MAGPSSGGIFISYRRLDTSALAGWLHDRLAGRFGDEQVFRDVDAIVVGADFTDVIVQAVSSCEVLLAIIGPQWLTVTDEAGRRRLENPGDLVRLEIAAALERGIRVIPILAEGAVMPRRQELPEDLMKLAQRNALRVRQESLRADVARLLAAIEQILGPQAAPDRAAAASTRAMPEPVDSQRSYASYPVAEQVETLRVFLCHASPDKPAVRYLHRRLQDEGIEPWLDEVNILPGQDWDHQIRTAIRSSHVVLVCLSRASINRIGYLQKEIRHVLDVADEQPPGTIFLIPVRLEECNVPDRISRWQWVDMFEEYGYARLMLAFAARRNDLSKHTE